MIQELNIKIYRLRTLARGFWLAEDQFSLTKPYLPLRMTARRRWSAHEQWPHSCATIWVSLARLPGGYDL